MSLTPGEARVLEDFDRARQERDGVADWRAVAAAASFEDFRRAAPELEAKGLVTRGPGSRITEAGRAALAAARTQ